MYKKVRFQTRPMEEILEDIDAAADLYGNAVKTVFLPDGNTIILSTRKLLTILERIAERFPDLERVTSYGSARFVIRKDLEDLKKLRAAGLKRIHMGMESGDGPTLERIRKGTTPDEIIAAGRRVRNAGIEISEYYLVGLGGLERSESHARESARVLNAVAADFVRLRTLVLVPGTPLWEETRSGDFAPPGILDCLRELRLLVENLECKTLLLSDHISNYVDLNGRFPEDREALLSGLDECLAMDEDDFGRRPPWWAL
jgi:radical SAM superfamily enzyme YgiQ (UPF0313 family)